MELQGWFDFGCGCLLGSGKGGLTGPAWHSQGCVCVGGSSCDLWAIRGQSSVESSGHRYTAPSPPPHVGFKVLGVGQGKGS